MATVVLPAPPFCETTAITRPSDDIDRPPFCKESVDVKIDVKFCITIDYAIMQKSDKPEMGSERAMKWAIFCELGECLT
jgi:hypothetical protein